MRLCIIRKNFTLGILDNYCLCEFVSSLHHFFILEKNKKKESPKLGGLVKTGSIHETGQVQAAIISLSSSKKVSVMPYRRWQVLWEASQIFTSQLLSLGSRAHSLHVQAMLLAWEWGGTVFEFRSQVVCMNGNSHFRGHV